MYFLLNCWYHLHMYTAGIGCQPENDTVWGIEWHFTKAGVVAKGKCPGLSESSGNCNLYMYVYVCMYVHIYICVYICVYIICTHIHTCVHTSRLMVVSHGAKKSRPMR